MRAAASMLFLAGLVLCGGCFTTTPPIAMTSVPKDTPKAPPPVTPERVNDENYRAMAQALWDEMDREQQQFLLVKTPKE